MKQKDIKAKVAHSKARIKARNARKALAKTLQGVPMFVSEEEALLREKEERKPITPKKWKVMRKLQVEESRKNSPKIAPKDFYCEELKERRKKRRQHLKELKTAYKDKFSLQVTHFPSCCSTISEKQSTVQANWNMNRLRMKEADQLARKQSKEDKAKYKASLVAFKEAHVCTNKVQENNILDAKPRHKKNRKAGRKSTARVYSMRKKAKLAA